MDDRLSRRRQCFIAAAEQLFIEQGFDRTALADVVKRAGGSLATLYKLFGGKAGLLEAVMVRRVEQSGARMVEFATADRPPREVLLRLAGDLRHNFVDPAEVALSRVVIAYSIEDPDFARRFYGATIMKARRRLAALFARWRDQGQSLTADPDLLAAMFVGMFIYESHSQAIAHGSCCEVDEASLEAKVEFFCQGAGLR